LHIKKYTAGININESIPASKKISPVTDKRGKNDKMSIIKASVKNIEERIISARGTGLIKAFVDVLSFFNVHILNRRSWLSFVQEDSKI